MPMQQATMQRASGKYPPSSPAPSPHLGTSKKSISLQLLPATRWYQIIAAIIFPYLILDDSLLASSDEGDILWILFPFVLSKLLFS